MAVRPILILATHSVLIALTSYLALWLRFDGSIPPSIVTTYVQLLPWVLAIRGLAFLPFGLYKGLWRYTGIWDLTRIVLGVLSSSVLLYLLLYRDLGAGVYPRSALVIDSLLLISFLGGVRLLPRIIPLAIGRHRDRRVLIVGAGDAGEVVVREMRRSGAYRPVGFVDDDPAKSGRTIHGVKVLGTTGDVSRIVTATRPSEVLVAMPSAGAAAIRNIVRRLEPFKLSITTLPGLQELVNGRVDVTRIRPVVIEDLLPRAQVPLDAAAARELVCGKRVLVTGAGGSIGSELCRQIATFEPASLVLFERYENGLYAVANELADRGTGAAVYATIGDVTDLARVDAIFTTYRPHIVFHAAAHKHVPLMEANPCEAVKNNVLGTQVVADAARRYGTERFVLISTDKAVNPSSIMGATKWVAELIVQDMSAQGITRFVTVRFGNVLGSNGSVIPRMLDQIRAGGPVTVTHSGIRRYFMLIPEAVQLVLQAAALAGDRETYVLDMGEPIKILDVARNLIRLAGFVPDEEISITFIGLRPGEKLSEELAGEGETLEPAGDRILRVPWPSARTMRSEVIRALVRAASQERAQEVIGLLSTVVPTFTPLAAGSPVRAYAVPGQRAEHGRVPKTTQPRMVIVKSSPQT